MVLWKIASLTCMYLLQTSASLEMSWDVLRSRWFFFQTHESREGSCLRQMAIAKMEEMFVRRVGQFTWINAKDHAQVPAGTRWLSRDTFRCDMTCPSNLAGGSNGRLFWSCIIQCQRKTTRTARRYSLIILIDLTVYKLKEVFSGHPRVNLIQGRKEANKTRPFRSLAILLFWVPVTFAIQTLANLTEPNHSKSKPEWARALICFLHLSASSGSFWYDIRNGCSAFCAVLKWSSVVVGSACLLRRRQL